MLTSLSVSAYCWSTYFRMLDTCHSRFSSRLSWKSNPGVSTTVNNTLSYLDSQISTHAVLISSVRSREPRRKLSTAARWSGVAVGEMSAVSNSSRRREVLPVPRPPTI